MLQLRSAPPAECARLSTVSPTTLSHFTLGASCRQKSAGETLSARTQSSFDSNLPFLPWYSWYSSSAVLTSSSEGSMSVSTSSQSRLTSLSAKWSMPTKRGFSTYASEPTPEAAARGDYGAPPGVT